MSIVPSGMPTAQADHVARRLPVGHVWLTMPSETIGDRLRRFRRRKGYSQRELAELSGVSRQFIAELERNAVTIPREPDNVRALAGTLGVSMHDLAAPTGWYDDDEAKEDWRSMLWRDERLDDDAKKTIQRLVELELGAAERKAKS